MANTYHSKLDQRYIRKLRVLENELPYYCTHYFNATGHVLSPQTEYGYAVDFKVFYDFIKQHLDEYEETAIKNIPADIFNQLTSHDIDAYMAYLESYTYLGVERKNSSTGKQRKLASINSLCKYLIKENLIYKNPADTVYRPKAEAVDFKPLSDKDIALLFKTIYEEEGMTDYQKKINQWCKKRDYAIMMLFLGTGMRISELVGLDIDDLDFHDNTAQLIRKGGKKQHVYFTEQIAKALKDYIGDGSEAQGTRNALVEDDSEPALFLSLHKNRISVRTVQQLIEKYCALAYGEKDKHKIHAHLFRKTYGTKLYQTKKDIKLVQDTLGHSSISTTEKHYVKSSEEYKKQAAMDVL